MRAAQSLHETFRQLSQTLTGEAELEAGRVSGLMDRLRRDPDGVHLDRLLQIYEEILSTGKDLEAEIKSRVLGDATLQRLAISIVLLWYTGDVYPHSTPAAPNPATEEQYFSALLWKIISAHPPGLSGGYFGHWTYPPD